MILSIMAFRSFLPKKKILSLSLSDNYSQDFLSSSSYLLLFLLLLYTVWKKYFKIGLLKSLFIALESAFLYVFFYYFSLLFFCHFTQILPWIFINLKYRLRNNFVFSPLMAFFLVYLYWQELVLMSWLDWSKLCTIFDPLKCC